MEATRLSQAVWLKKGEFFTLFFILETMVIAIIPLSARPEWIDTLLVLHGGFTAAFLAVSWLLHRNGENQEIWPVFYVLFVLGAAILVSTLWHMDLTRLFRLPPGSPQEISLAAFLQGFLRAVVVLALMVIIGGKRALIYVQKGNLRLGLTAGLLGFLLLAAVAFLPLTSQAGATGRLLKLLPWILLFVLSNGFAEELVFRGLLLKQYERFLGKGLANLLAAFVFTLVHFQASYVPNANIFLLGVFPLALLWGALMQKTDSLIGPGLFHAGADCLIIFGIYATS